jgi:hypothetical protein
MIMTLVFEKKANFLPNIDKNRKKLDNNIDPWNFQRATVTQRTILGVVAYWANVFFSFF